MEITHSLPHFALDLILVVRDNSLPSSWSDLTWRTPLHRRINNTMTTRTGTPRLAVIGRAVRSSAALCSLSGQGTRRRNVDHDTGGFVLVLR